MKLTQILKLKRFLTVLVTFALSLCFILPGTAQQSGANTSAHTYPSEIRGYKLERAKIKIRHEENARPDQQADALADQDALIEFGEPRLSSFSPLGITLEVPVKIAAVKQGGKVDFLTFEDITVNGTPVTVEDYNHPFDLPNRKPLSLPEPIKLYISTPRALTAALGEWNNSQPTWPVTGRVYVFGRFKKFIMHFKRVVPIELNLSLPNPLRSRT
ncbi:MAG: hypothetical protein AUG51_20625 [Acidobacteria bacterium 13_1_20CM_3_53_8]|nr:MAG: hypothetical protein AUG51_20625 [Acidobacteria bacterium 13_1_20CM_3_53_8]